MCPHCTRVRYINKFFDLLDCVTSGMGESFSVIVQYPEIEFPERDDFKARSRAQTSLNRSLERRDTMIRDVKEWRGVRGVLLVNHIILGFVPGKFGLHDHMLVFADGIDPEEFAEDLRHDLGTGFRVAVDQLANHSPEGEIGYSIWDHDAVELIDDAEAGSFDPGARAKEIERTIRRRNNLHHNVVGPVEEYRRQKFKISGRRNYRVLGTLIGGCLEWPRVRELYAVARVRLLFAAGVFGLREKLAGRYVYRSDPDLRWKKNHPDKAAALPQVEPSAACPHCRWTVQNISSVDALGQVLCPVDVTGKREEGCGMRFPLLPYFKSQDAGAKTRAMKASGNATDTVSTHRSNNDPARHSASEHLQAEYRKDRLIAELAQRNSPAVAKDHDVAVAPLTQDPPVEIVKIVDQVPRRPLPEKPRRSRSENQSGRVEASSQTGSPTAPPMSKLELLRLRCAAPQPHRRSDVASLILKGS
jgi:hypothetical protein